MDYIEKQIHSQVERAFHGNDPNYQHQYQGSKNTSGVQPGLNGAQPGGQLGYDPAAGQEYGNQPVSGGTKAGVVDQIQHGIEGFLHSRDTPTNTSSAPQGQLGQNEAGHQGGLSGLSNLLPFGHGGSSAPNAGANAGHGNFMDEARQQMDAAVGRAVINNFTGR